MSEQDKLEQERDRLANEFADLSVSINGKNDTEDQKQLYWYGVRHGYSNGFDAATEIHQHILAEKDKRIERLREALEGLLYYWANTPCRFDHNGNCQAHSCFGYDRTCSVADARAALQEDK